MLVLRHKLFELPKGGPYWGQGALLRAFDDVRHSVEEFAGKVGVENVVSVVEHMQPQFTLIVWYREEQAAKAAKPSPTDEFAGSPSD